MENKSREIIEELIREYPVFEYALIDSAQVPFSEKVRSICEQECPMYNKSHSCPPAVGSVAECIDRCGKFSDVFVFSTVSEVADITDMNCTLTARAEHSESVRGILSAFRESFGPVFALSAEACAICPQCAWPENECRHLDKMLPCIESHGILVTALAQKCGMSFMLPGNTVVWFAMIFFNSKAV